MGWVKPDIIVGMLVFLLSACGQNDTAVIEDIINQRYTSPLCLEIKFSWPVTLPDDALDDTDQKLLDILTMHNHVQKTIKEVPAGLMGYRLVTQYTPTHDLCYGKVVPANIQVGDTNNNKRIVNFILEPVITKEWSNIPELVPYITAHPKPVRVPIFKNDRDKWQFDKPQAY